MNNVVIGEFSRFIGELSRYLFLWPFLPNKQGKWECACRIRRQFRVASASVRDGDSGGAVVLAPDYGSQNKYQIQRRVHGGPGAGASRSGNLA